MRTFVPKRLLVVPVFAALVFGLLGLTPAVAAGALLAPVPGISGTAAVGSKLVSVSGTWTAGTVLKYQWLRSGGVISGASASSLTLAAADLGKAISVRVTGAKAGYATVSRTSKTSAAVAAGVLLAPVPGISGTAAVGSKLLAVPGSWTGGTVLIYQWLRSGVAIPGATASSLTLAPADLGKAISVKVTGGKAGYSLVAKTSKTSGAVAAGSLLAPVPGISGPAAVASKLLAVSGSWTAGTVLKYQWLRSGVAIPGAVASSLTLAQADLGKAISVQVTGSLTGYATVSRTSMAVVAGALLAPVPGISGTSAVGSKLLAVPSSWTAGTVLKYQWLRSGVAIPGAVASSLIVAPADLGKGISVQVTGSKAGYSTVSRTSKAGGTVVAGSLLAPVPGISGTSAVGSKLAAVPGTWTAGTSLKYQWLRSGVALPGATASTLALAPADLGKAISVKVTGSKAGYATVVKTGKTSGAVAAGVLLAPVPGISGTAAVGSKLVAVPGSWTGGTVLIYQWLRSGVAIPGATAPTLALAPADLGKAISVKVTGGKAGYSLVSKTSTAVVAGALLAPLPSVSGAASVASKLFAVPGTWTAGTVLKYQWLRSGVAIPGAVASSLTLTPADLGKAISVTVAGSKAGYSTTAKTSKTSGAVAAGALLAPVPVLSGPAAVGSKLAAVPGAWTAGTSLKYQWLRSGVAVPGATASSLTLGTADRGKAISVKVTGSQTGYSTASKTSQTSALVSAPPAGVPSLNDPFVAESFKLINDYRVKNKLRPLKWNPGVATVSQKWAGHLLLDFASPSWDGTWHNWNFYANYPAGWSGAGENVALNTSAKTMFNWWVASPGHNANMLNPGFTDFGFGYAKYTSGPYDGLAMGVQNFARY